MPAHQAHQAHQSATQSATRSGNSSAGLSEALRGKRVLELPGGLAAEHCGYALAGLGAEVLAVRPQTAAAHARLHPLDAVKQVRSLDLDATSAFDTLAALAGTCDLLIEERPPLGWPASPGMPSSAPRSGAPADAASAAPVSRRVLARHPHLIALCLSPFGLNGPQAGFAAYPLNCYHAGGHGQQMPNDALRSSSSEVPPMQAGGEWGEAQAGTLAAIAGVAALLHPAPHAGTLIDCAKQEALIHLHWIDAVRFPNQGRSPSRLAPLATIVGGILPASDGYVQAAVREDHHWAAIATLLNHPEWVDDPRYATRAGRSARWREIAALLAAETRKLPTQHLHLRGRELGIPIAEVFSLASLRSDTDLAARGTWRRDGRESGLGSGSSEHATENCSGSASAAIHRADAMSTLAGSLPRWDTCVTACAQAAAATLAKASAAGNSARPLQGLRVLDLGWVAMGPYAGYLLSCLGAEVIHVASPHTGAMAGVDKATYNYGFDTLNTGKTWVAIDLKQRAGVDLLRQLAARCDSVLENFRPGVSARLGIGYSMLSAAHPRLVMLSASTYGERHMPASYPGYAPVFAALAGLSDLTGDADGPPAEVSTPVDFFAGAVGVLGLLAGLHLLRSTGRGCHIDFSAREAVLWSLSHALGMIEAGQHAATRCGNSHPALSPHGVYPCAGDNRWLSIAIGSDGEWQRLCACVRAAGTSAAAGAGAGAGASADATAAGVGAALDDPRFATMTGRIAHRAALDALLAHWTRGHALWPLCEQLQQAGIAAYPSATSEDLWNNPHLRARGLFQPSQPGFQADSRTWHAGAPWVTTGQARSALRTTDGATAIEQVFGGLLELPHERIAALLRVGVIAARTRPA